MKDEPNIEWRVDGDTAVYLIDNVGMHFKKKGNLWFAYMVESEFYEAINDYSPEGFNTSQWMNDHSDSVFVVFNYDEATWIAAERK